jgi:hypothetical protein
MGYIEYSAMGEGGSLFAPIILRCLSTISDNKRKILMENAFKERETMKTKILSAEAIKMLRPKDLK